MNGFLFGIDSGTAKHRKAILRPDGNFTYNNVADKKIP